MLKLINLSSRAVAVLIALLVAGVLTVAAVLTPRLPTSQAFLVGGFTVAACFLLVYLSFEALIFREINSIYSRLEHIKRKEFKKLSNKFLFRPEPLRRLGDEIVEMAERRQQELDELKRLQALRREFLADVSHELKTPLFAAQGFVHTILDEEEAEVNESGMDPATRRKFLRRAAASLDSLNTLVQDLVTISQLEKGVIRMRRQRFDLVALVHELFELLEPQEEEKPLASKLQFKILPPLPSQANYLPVEKTMGGKKKKEKTTLEKLKSSHGEFYFVATI